HNAASAADSSPGQIAFVMFEIRDDLVLPLQRHRNIILTHISSDRKFDACGHQSRCDKRNTEESRLQHLQPKLNDGVHTTSHLAAGDVHARHSRLQADEGRARTAHPPAAATTWLVSSAAFIMAAPLAGLANAFDAPSAPTPTATMAAASIARIWLLLFLADTLGRATD